MTKDIKKYIGVVAVAVIIIISLSFFSFPTSIQKSLNEVSIGTVEQNSMENDSASLSLTEQVSDTGQPRVQVVVSHLELPEYAGNPRLTLQLGRPESRYVFVGKILGKIGQVRTRTGVATQYQAQVLNSIHKKLSGVVTLNQSGVGYLDDGRLIVRDGDIARVANVGEVDPNEIFLKVGATYLLDTISTEGKEFTISIPPYDRELISVDPLLSKAEALTRARENDKVQAYVTAATELGILNEEWQ